MCYLVKNQQLSEGVGVQINNHLLLYGQPQKKTLALLFQINSLDFVYLKHKGNPFCIYIFYFWWLHQSP